MNGLHAILFDVFGTIVDWRGSLIRDFAAWGPARGFSRVDWAGFVDAWRAAYVPSMERVRSGQIPWANLDELQRMSLAELGPRFGLPAHLPEADQDYLLRGWHRLDPWPDSVLGLRRLKAQYIIAPLSNGSVALLVHMAKRAALPWDAVLATELFRHYKPDPETYLGAVSLLGLKPEQVMMAAAHNGDLRAARALGLRTAFVPRPTEYGPAQRRDLQAEEPWDIVAADIEDLATRLNT
ncbi:MAG: haloacid dehalogenase type II [Acetobacteraceae bacterium]|nr:haloacid dehalogenase type II [Acetobacteraceae bacterium]